MQRYKKYSIIKNILKKKHIFVAKNVLFVRQSLKNGVLMLSTKLLALNYYTTAPVAR